jgi:hypothetical protein
VGDDGEVGNESMIEVTEANKRAYPLDRGRGVPLVNGSELCRVHGDVSLLDDHSEVFYLRHRKGALLGLQV